MIATRLALGTRARLTGLTTERMDSFWHPRPLRQFACPPFLQMVVDLGCALAVWHPQHVCAGPIDPHHTPAKSQRPRDWSDHDVVGLCRAAHDECEKITDAVFQAKYAIDFAEIKRAYVIRFLELALGDAVPPTARKSKASTKKKLADFNHYKKPC
jgi:hypothetical protein